MSKSDAEEAFERNPRISPQKNAQELVPDRQSLFPLLLSQEEKERLTALINSIQDEVWFVDKQGKLTLVNRAVLDEFGTVTAVQDVEKIAALFKVYRPDGTPRPAKEAPPLRALQGELIRGEEEIVWTPAKGELRHRQVSAAPLRGRDGEILGSISVARDITDLKRTEKELNESEQRYRALAEKSPDAIIVHRQNQFLYANPAALALYGADTFSQLEERKVYDFLHPDYGDAAHGILKDLEEGKPLPEREARLVRLDGREVYVETYGAYIIYGESRAVQVILRDITERKRTEKALLEANITLECRIQERTAELAQRAAQLRALAGELTLTEQRERKRLAIFLHDHLQQLLVAAKYRMSVLGKGLDSITLQSIEEIEELIDDCIRASRSLTAELCPQVLHEAGLHAGLRWLAKRVAAKQGLTVNLQLEEVRGIPDDLKIVLFESVRELLFNIVKHAHTNNAFLKLQHAQGYLDLTVSDEGTGFDPSASLLSGESGGGFGLFAVRERVELFGGKLKIDSAPGQGTRIMLRAPIAAALEAKYPRATQPKGSEPASTPASALRKKVRIMLADDHKIVRQGLASLICTQPDLEIVGEAGDGIVSVELAGKLMPDIILMDVNMPKMNGIEATRIIHANFPHIRIIGLSMYDDVEQSKAIRDAGAMHYLTKSGPAEDLIETIRDSFMESSH